jgi:pimeloyl-ACP methyl ester carboxylesterase
MSCWTKYELELAAWLSRVSTNTDPDQVRGWLMNRSWKLISLITNTKTDTHGFLARDPYGSMALVFRCTTTKQNVKTDLNAEPTHGMGATVHEGFWEAYDSVAKQVHELLTQNPVTMVQPSLMPISALRGGEISLLVVGHSLGGALATLAALDLTFSQFSQNIGLITLGCPRVGFRDFVRMFEERMGSRYVRIMCGNDIITQIPVSPYKHPEGLLHIDAAGRELGALRRGWVLVRDWFRSLFGFGVALAKWDTLPDHAWSHYNQAIQNLKPDWERKS